MSEASDALFAERELLHLGGAPQAITTDAVRASLRRADDAVRFTELLQVALGDRAWADPQAGPAPDLHLYGRDATDGRWLVPTTLAEVDVQWRPVAVPMSGGPHDALVEAWMEQDRKERQSVLPSRRFPHPVHVQLNQGPALIGLSYDDRGVLHECTRTTGDAWWSSRHGDAPHAIDPLARPPQAPPHHLLLYPGLEPAGNPVEELVAWMARIDPGRWHRGRVYMPCPQPGGATLTWRGTLRHLRALFWQGRIPDDASGWLVLDAWAGQVWTMAPTLAEATDAWLTEVARTCPMPHVAGAPEEELPPPEDDDDPMRDLGEPDISPARDEGTVIASAEMRIVIAPRVTIPSPPVRPENVPAIALPITPLPHPPPGWSEIGFERQVRMVGEWGAVWSVLVREEDRGYTLVPEALWPGIDPKTLDDQLQEAEAGIAADRASLPASFRMSGWDDPAYPVFQMGLSLLDPPAGRRYKPRLVRTSYGRSAHLDPRDRGARWHVEHWRRVR